VGAGGHTRRFMHLFFCGVVTAALRTAETAYKTATARGRPIS